MISKQGCCADKACTPATCMDLPKGTTCGDCIHLSRCATLFGCKPENTVCDWFPRRFVDAMKPTKFITIGTPVSATEEMIVTHNPVDPRDARIFELEKQLAEREAACAGFQDMAHVATRRAESAESHARVCVKTIVEHETLIASLKCTEGKWYDKLQAADEELATARAENQCDACCGTGKPISGLPCMCGGTGKMSDAVIYMRERLVRAEAALAAEQERHETTFRELSAMRKDNDRLRFDLNDVLRRDRDAPSELIIYAPKSNVGIGTVEKTPIDDTTIRIPDISSREFGVRVISELKYRLKARLIDGQNDAMLEDFNLLLNGFIQNWKLDSDPHKFATLPIVRDEGDRISVEKATHPITIGTPVPTNTETRGTWIDQPPLRTTSAEATQPEKPRKYMGHPSCKRWHEVRDDGTFTGRIVEMMDGQPSKVIKEADEVDHVSDTGEKV